MAASSSSVSRPHGMVPSASRDTIRPLRPSARCSTRGQLTGAPWPGPARDTGPGTPARAALRPCLSGPRTGARPRLPPRAPAAFPPRGPPRAGIGRPGMSWFEAVVLGVVQGLTEFLPISSSAHLRIVGAAFGWDDPGAAVTAITQIGTEGAVLLYYRTTIGRIISIWLRSLRDPVLRKDPDARMGWLIIIGSIPIVVLGLLFQDRIETTFRDLRIIAISLVTFSLSLFWADRVGRTDRQLADLTVGHGVLYGLAQAMALIPGVSRSGGTITMGRFLGYSRSAAADYSFLLAVPAVLGSGFYQAAQSLDGGVAWGPTILATVIAFGVGYAVIAWLLRYLSHGSFTPFVVYRVVLGLALLALVGSGMLDPA